MSQRDKEGVEYWPVVEMTPTDQPHSELPLNIPPCATHQGTTRGHLVTRGLQWRKMGMILTQFSYATYFKDVKYISLVRFEHLKIFTKRHIVTSIFLISISTELKWSEISTYNTCNNMQMLCGGLIIYRQTELFMGFTAHILSNLVIMNLISDQQTLVITHKD